MTEQNKVRMFTLVFDKRRGERKSILVVRGLGRISILCTMEVMFVLLGSFL